MTAKVRVKNALCQTTAERRVCVNEVLATTHKVETMAGHVDTGRYTYLRYLGYDTYLVYLPHVYI